MTTIRTVKLLDRTRGEPLREVKTVKGTTIDRDIPSPPPRGRVLLEVLFALEPGESFLAKHQASSSRVSQRVKGRTFVGRRQPDGMFRIWRLE